MTGMDVRGTTTGNAQTPLWPFAVGGALAAGGLAYVLTWSAAHALLVAAGALATPVALAVVVALVLKFRK
jgi:hypothetical protein